MTTTEINILLNLLGTSPTQIAKDLQESRVMISQVFNYERPNARLRRRIEKHLAQRLQEKLFALASTPAATTTTTAHARG